MIKKNTKTYTVYDFVIENYVNNEINCKYVIKTK